MSIKEGFLVRALWEGGKAGMHRLLGNGIKIVIPGSDGLLSQPEDFYGGKAYIVRGTLKRLPKDHRIWLLTEEYAGAPIRPHGFFPVIYNETDRTWWGKVNSMGKQRFRLIAVVAPPTSDDFFTYYQKVGMSTRFEPLKRIPPECRNMAFVQVTIV